MTEVNAANYISPEEKLNQIRSQGVPSAEAAPRIDFRAEVAKGIYIGAFRDLLSKPQNIQQDDIKLLAVMSVDAADILVSQLAKGRR